MSSLPPLAAVDKFISFINPLPRVLKLLPAKVAREVVVVLVAVAGVLIGVNEILLPASSEVHTIINAVLGVFLASGVRGEVTPVADPGIPGLFPPKN